MVDAADVHTQTRDANPDKDGWRNFAGLPWTSQILGSGWPTSETEPLHCTEPDRGPVGVEFPDGVG